jgi:uncharacterized membrane protein
VVSLMKFSRWPLGERGLTLFWFFFVVLYSVLSLFRHWHFGSNAYDLGIADHAIWHYSRFEVPSDTISHFGNLLGDHFDPLLALLAPLYWICPRVEMILIAQAVLLTLPVFPVFLFTRKRLGRLPAYCFAISYALLWGVQLAAEFDFHELCVAVPAAAFAIYFADEEKWAGFWASIVILALSKEDMCLLAVFFGLVLVWKRQYRRGGILAVGALFFFIFEVKFLIPHLGNRPYRHWNYSQLGSGPLEALKTCLLHPLKVLLLIFSTRTKIITVFCLFLPFFFGALFSPWCLLAVPLIGERMLSDNPLFWAMLFHYNVVPGAVLCFASADGFQRWAGWIRDPSVRDKRIRGAALFLLAFNLVTCQLPRFPLGHLIRHPFWRFNETERMGKTALALIPNGASVLAQSSLVPHLSHRQVIDMLSVPALSRPPVEDYVVVCLGKDTWPLENKEDIPRFVRYCQKQGYETLLDREGWFVLKKSSKGDVRAH